MRDSPSESEITAQEIEADPVTAIEELANTPHESSGNSPDEMGRIQRWWDRVSNRRERYYVYSTVMFLLFGLGAFWFAYHLPEYSQKLFAAVFFAGAAGGALFAVRESFLIWPRLDANTIHLGWIADCAFGVAGAFVVFLLVPGLSESAENGFKELFAKETAIELEQIQQEGTDGAKTVINVTADVKMDLLEVIAVAIVGGFAGRSVLANAETSFLPNSRKPTKNRAENDSKSN